MRIYNTPTDVVLEFSTFLDINRLLHSMGLECISSVKSHYYENNRYFNRTKFSINVNGEYKLFSSVNRGYTIKCSNEHCKDCSHHGCYSEPSYEYRPQPNVDNLEGASEYNQSVNKKYSSIVDGIRIIF